MISAGRVLLMPKGDYDPTATYEMLDIVSYNGSSYIAKSTTTGNLPTNTTYWQLSAYGGQASNLAGNFAPLETTEYATRAYATDDIFVDKDSQLVIATMTINIGDEIEIGSNCDVTTMAELLDAIENRYDALDQRNRKLVGINPITIQTDLHLLAPGEYFKKLTTFYVTNAPAGIDQVPTAIFRLTVESGLDENGSSLLLTLRKIEGEIYTQAYDGSVWSDWKKTGDIADVPTYTGATSVTSGVKGLVPAATAAEKNNYLKGDGTWGSLGTAAAKDSTDVVTEDSTALVESGAVFSELAKRDAEIADMNNVLGAKNLLRNNISSKTVGGVTLTVNSDGSITANGTATQNIVEVIENHSFDVGSYILSGCPSGGSSSNGYSLVVHTKGYDIGNGFEFDITTKSTLDVRLIITNGTTVDNVTFKPMIRLASIQDDTYEPYSMTNKEMTPYVQAISNPNLLDNPWFTVNQRGITSWSNESGGYSADRWKHDRSATGNITNGVYTCNVPTYQNWEDDRITPLLGKTVTLSWILSDGSIGFETKTLPSVLTSAFVWPFTNNYVVLALKSGNVSQAARIQAGVAVKAVKLELGSVSTLAMDTTPNYTTELLKCQRYFVRFLAPESNYSKPIGFGICASATDFRGSIILPCPMRINPTLTVSSVSNFRITGNQQNLTPSSITMGKMENNIASIRAVVADAITNVVYCILDVSPGEYLDFSADL